MTISAQREGDRLSLRVADDGEGMKGREECSMGMGLSNTRACLAGLYGRRATMRISPACPSGTEVLIDLPLRKDVHA